MELEYPRVQDMHCATKSWCLLSQEDVFPCPTIWGCGLGMRSRMEAEEAV